MQGSPKIGPIYIDLRSPTSPRNNPIYLAPNVNVPATGNSEARARNRPTSLSTPNSLSQDSRLQGARDRRNSLNEFGTGRSAVVETSKNVTRGTKRSSRSVRTTQMHDPKSKLILSHLSALPAIDGRPWS